VDSFNTLSVDKNRHFFTPPPLILSTSLLNAPLADNNWRYILHLVQIKGGKEESWIASTELITLYLKWKLNIVSVTPESMMNIMISYDSH
jgi:hypothetical protein